MAQVMLDSVLGARALYYDFFAGLFLYELLCGREDVLLKQVNLLQENVLSEDDRVHFEMLDNELKTHGTKRIIEEHTHLFLLPFNTQVSQDNVLRRRKKGEVFYNNTQVMLYLSHYLEGCLNGKALLKVRGLVKKSTFRLNTKECGESEEHLGFLLLLMRYLLCSSDGEDRALSVQVAKEVTIPLGDFVIAALQEREDVSHYKHIASLLKHFLSVERSLL